MNDGVVDDVGLQWDVVKKLQNEEYADKKNLQGFGYVDPNQDQHFGFENETQINIGTTCHSRRFVGCQMCLLVVT